MDTQILPPNDESIKKAAELIKAGELIAFPTETVYGLGASIFNVEAIQKIFTVKGRPTDNPLIAHISSLAQVELIGKNIPPEFSILSDNFFPGPLTIVVQKQEQVPNIASAQLSTIGIRMPHHQVAWKLIEASGTPLVAPSANLSGKPSPTTAAHVLEDLSGKIPLILDGGPCDVGIESTVLDLTTSPPVILRPGHITKEQIESVLHRPVVFASVTDAQEKVKAPGMKYRHYAPNAIVHVITTLDQLAEISKTLRPNQTMMITNIHLPATYEFKVILPLTEKGLYASFRKADDAGIQDILIFTDEETKKNIGLLNRIEKAAKKI